MSLPPFVPAEVSVVVPTLNERENVLELARRLREVLATVAWEMIVVDDDSRDGTWVAAKELAAHDPRVRCIRRIGRRGLAGACIEGMLASAAPVVAVMDADLQHDERVLPRLIDPIRAGTSDIVVATRNIEGGSKNEGLTPVRRVISDAGRRLARLVLHADLSDPMSGFFAIRRDLVERVAPELTTSGFKILADIAASVPRGTRVAEVPYTFRERAAGESKLTLQVGLDYLGLLLNKLTRGLIPLRFIFFSLVGASGVIVHLAILRVALTGVGERRFAVAQAIATIGAMTWNFALNNLLTYRDTRLSGLSFVTGLLWFYIVCGIGAVANVGIATWVYEGQSIWWLAGLAGALVGAVWNYAASSTFVWRRAG